MRTPLYVPTQPPMPGTPIDWQHPFANQLKACWVMNAGAGNTVADIGPGGFHGTLVNAPSWTGGDYGSTLDFNGTNQVVSVPFAPAVLGQQFTCCAIVRCMDASNSRGIFGAYTPGIVGGQWTSGSQAWRFYPSGPNISWNMPLNTWSAISVTFNYLGTSFVCCNGNIVARVTGGAPNTHSSFFYIGKAYNSSDRFWLGQISLVSCHARAWTMNEAMSWTAAPYSMFWQPSGRTTYYPMSNIALLSYYYANLRRAT